MTVFTPVFDHHGRIVHVKGSNCRRKDIKQQGRTRPTGSMLRKPFISTRQPSTNRFGPRRLAFVYPHALLSQAGERTRGIHADGRRPFAYGGRHGSVGLVHGWNTRCRYGVPERSLPFTPCSLMPRNVFHGVSDGLTTVPPQTLRNTAETRRKPFWKAFSRVISQVCLRIGENAIRGNPSNATVQNVLNPTLERAGSLSSCDWA